MRIFKYFILFLLFTVSYAETISLNNNWNLVGIDNNMTLSELKTKVGIDNLLVVQGENKVYKRTYIDEEKDFLNDFKFFEKGRGYWIKVKSAVSFEYIENSYGSNEHILLTEGWNLINPLTNLTLEAIQEQLGESLEVIQGASKVFKKSYLSINPALNDFEKFEISKGYWIKVSEEKVLNYEAASYYKPTLNDTWQWQLQGELNSSYAVNIYDIDLFDSNLSLINTLKEDGKKVMCYFSAGSYENWRDDKDDFLSEELGNNLDGWEGEKWIDVRSQNVRNIMKRRLELAVQKGCDGVETDNVDGYTTDNNSGFDFTATDQIDYNKFLATYAHELGLFIALKNDLNQIEALVDYFDLSVNEQCFQYDECNLLSPFISQNKPVFNAEYNSQYLNDKEKREQLCESSIDLGFQTLVLPLDLDGSFRYACDKMLFSPIIVDSPRQKSFSREGLTFKLKYLKNGEVQTSGCTDLVSNTIVAGVETTFTFTSLDEGTYTECNISIVDDNGNASTLITLPEFTVFKVLTTSLYKGRSDGKGLDYVIIADGFQASEMELFRSKAKEFADYILDYDSNLTLEKGAWNIHLLELASKESGADNIDGENGTQVDTALDSYFWCGGTSRLLCTSGSKAAFVIGEFVPQFDKILVLVNSNKYGGAGGSYATASLGGGQAVAVHELGHSLAGLADEYEYGSNSAPTYEPSQPNVTINNDANTVKWKHWLDEDAGSNGPVGLFEGGLYVHENVWRPTSNSIMRNLGKPFYQVNAEAWALSVYRIVGVSYGHTPTITEVSQVSGTDTLFRVEPSMGSSAQKITWQVNDVNQSISNDNFTFSYGSNENSSFVVEEMSGELLLKIL